MINVISFGFSVLEIQMNLDVSLIFVKIILNKNYVLKIIFKNNVFGKENVNQKVVIKLQKIIKLMKIAIIIYKVALCL